MQGGEAARLAGVAADPERAEASEADGEADGPSEAAAVG